MRIFISHGTDKTRADELAFLDTLQARLAAAPAAHDVLLDRTRIGAGDDWNGVLDDLLAECQGAVLLLSRRALDRPWVWKEATLLSHRKARDAAFPFFCVLLPEVSVEDVQARPALAALRLDALQAFAPGTAADAVADWVLQRAAAVQPPRETPLDRLERALEARLLNLRTTELEAVCEQLLGEPVAWVPALGRERQHARVLARGIARGRLGGVGSLVGLLKALKTAGLEGEHLQAVRKIVASMWIDAGIAGHLAVLAAGVPPAPGAAEMAGGPGAADAAGDEGDGGPPFAAALNGRRVRWSPAMAVWRALSPDTDDVVYWVEGGGSDAWEDELVARIRRAYRKGREDVIDDDEQVDEVLEARVQPVFVVLPPPVPDDALLRALRRRYPRVTFIVHTGADLPDAALLPPCVAPLAPGLDLDEEKTRHADYVSAMEIR